MPRLTDEQIAQAREVGLLAYLSACEPYELKRTGPNEYRTVTHGSLVITPDYWFWNKDNIGSPSALDYLTEVKNMPFVDAVHALLGAGLITANLSLPITQRVRAAPEKEDFKLPAPQRYGSAMVSYLQERGIHPKIISRCIEAQILFEGRYKGSPVCVFVGKDESGTPRFACVRGTNGDVKKDAPGSDKRYSFHLPAKEQGSRHLAVFEAPIDTLSHATLHMACGWKWNGYRLSLGGTSPIALIAFLERNPQITRVMLYLDNDPAGLINARRIKARLNADKRFSHIRVSVNPPRRGKDYNEQLQNTIHHIKEQKQLARNYQSAALL